MNIATVFLISMMTMKVVDGMMLGHDIRNKLDELEDDMYDIRVDIIKTNERVSRFADNQKRVADINANNHSHITELNEELVRLNRSLNATVNGFGSEIEEIEDRLDYIERYLSDEDSDKEDSEVKDDSKE